MIPLEELTGIRHIILLDLTKNLVRNLSLTYLYYLRIPLSNLITGLIRTGSLPQHYPDSLP